MTLKLVRTLDGEAGRSPADWKASWATLKAIERAADMLRLGAASPRQQFAGLVGLGVGIAFFALYIVGSFAGFRLPDATIIAGVATAAIAMLVARSRSRRATSWVDVLDAGLMRYEPVNQREFRRLQDRVREVGHYDRDIVFEWLCSEKYALQVAAGWRTPTPAGFLDKKL